MINHRSFNILGNIAIVNFSDKISLELKKKFAEQLLLKYPHIKTVLEKSGKFSGRLRKMKTKHLTGEKNKEVLYKENNCVFRFNLDTTYFSPRLSNERKEIASLIKKNEDVLVMFAGVAPYSICIAKNSEAKVFLSFNLVLSEKLTTAIFPRMLNERGRYDNLEIDSVFSILPKMLNERCLTIFI